MSASTRCKDPVDQLRAQWLQTKQTDMQMKLNLGRLEVRSQQYFAE